MKKLRSMRMSSDRSRSVFEARGIVCWHAGESFVEALLHEVGGCPKRRLACRVWGMTCDAHQRASDRDGSWRGLQAFEDCRVIAKEARAVVERMYDEEVLDEFTESLTPVFEVCSCACIAVASNLRADGAGKHSWNTPLDAIIVVLTRRYVPWRCSRS